MAKNIRGMMIDISQEEIKDYTELSGKTITERYRKGIAYTTKTMTVVIMTFLTLNYLQIANTWLSTTPMKRRTSHKDSKSEQ